MALTLDLISIPVSDQDRAKRFYVDVLGFKELMDHQMNDTMRWVMLQAPQGATRVALATWFDSMPAGSLKGMVLACNNLEAMLKELEAKGVKFKEQEILKAGWGQWKNFEDPDGNGWILQQHSTQPGQ
jgi:catechol 2,3-dioxygenase-like lactoylglutathione lyase family enzyme